MAQWAKLEVLSPLDGTIIERNVALGELVDTSTDLFKIADLSRLGVLAYAYEEDLPTLDSQPADQRAWSVAVGAGGPTAAGRIGRRASLWSQRDYKGACQRRQAWGWSAPRLWCGARSCSREQRFSRGSTPALVRTFRPPATELPSQSLFTGPQTPAVLSRSFSG